MKPIRRGTDEFLHRDCSRAERRFRRVPLDGQARGSPQSQTSGRAARIWVTTSGRWWRGHGRTGCIPDSGRLPDVALSWLLAPLYAVTNSFARLDLATAGFRLLAEASWIVGDGEPVRPPDDGLTWDKVTNP
jgi:hypothetical protein